MRFIHRSDPYDAFKRQKKVYEKFDVGKVIGPGYFRFSLKKDENLSFPNIIIQYMIRKLSMSRLIITIKHWSKMKRCWIIYIKLQKGEGHDTSNSNITFNAYHFLDKENFDDYWKVVFVSH